MSTPDWPTHCLEAVARVEQLDPLVGGVGDRQVPARVGRHRPRAGEVADAPTGASPAADETATRIELLDPVVRRVRDINVTRRIDRHRPRHAELVGARDVADRRDESQAAGQARRRDCSCRRRRRPPRPGRPRRRRDCGTGRRPVPRLPAWATNAPSGVNSSIRLLSSSATYTALAFAASPRGFSNCPAPVPVPPRRVTPLPSRPNRSIRSSPVSATKT